MNRTEKIGIVGSGLIGRSWAMLFAGVGYKVTIYDIEPSQIETALIDIKQQLTTLEKEGLLRGILTADEQYKCIKGSTSLQDAVSGAILVQECVPENLDLKIKVWKQVDDLAGPNTIYSSSTSTFMPSLFTKDLKNRQNAVVSHPVNPPYYVPLVEIVPAPWTDKVAALKTRQIMEEIGQVPVSLSREIEGFVLNRIQYAILNETWNLIADGVLDVLDTDKVMSAGLGPRYAFMGPLETAHLNAEGFENYCERYSKTIHAVSTTFKPLPKFEGPLVKKIADELETKVPKDKLQERRNWRDMCLTKLSQLKKKVMK